MARWIRSLGLVDPRISPNHSWRHWFVGACRGASMHVEVRSNSARLDESAGYGDGMRTFIQVLAAAIGKIVRRLPWKPSRLRLAPLRRGRYRRMPTPNGFSDVSGDCGDVCAV